MSLANSVMKGVIHGNVVTLDEDAGLPDGQEVNVTLQPMAKAESRLSGEGLRQSFGAWEEDSGEVRSVFGVESPAAKAGAPGD